MKKRILTTTTLLLSAALLAGCQSNTTRESGQTPAQTSSEAQTTAETSSSNSAGSEAEDDKIPLKAAMITPQKLGDNGPIDACYQGLQEGAADSDMISKSWNQNLESMRTVSEPCVTTDIL